MSGMRSPRPEGGPRGGVPPGGVRPRRRGGPLTRLLAGGLAAAVIVAPSEASARGGADRHPREMTYLKRQWGVEVMDVRQTAAGYMLEFRYRVVDAAKAKPLFERRTKPVLTHAETGARLVVPTPPTTGALRNSNPPLAGRTYWMFFANPGQLVKPGEHVNVRIGEFQVDGLVVR